MQFRLGDQVTIEVRVPGRQHQNHGSALLPGVVHKGLKRLDLGGAHLVEALHVHAVKAHAGFGGQGADLIRRLGTERHIVQNATVRPLDRRCLIVGVALHRVELDGIAVVIGDGGLAAVLYVVVHVALEVGRVG